jgi:broad specificity phosphatase PhoE
MNVSGQPYNQEVKAVMPALLVCVRHGNTDTSDPTIPNPNLPLTREGFRNGRRAGVWLTEQLVGSKVMPASNFDRAYFSPYKRARQTMGAIAMHTPIRRVPTPESRLALRDSDEVLAMITDLRLRELYYGDASRMSKAEMAVAFPYTVANRAADTLYGRTPNGDGMVEMFDRAHDMLGRYARGKKRGEDYVLSVHHGRTTRGTQIALLGLDPKDWMTFDKDPANEIGYTTRVMFSRHDPVTGKEYSTYHWTATSHMTPDNDEPPQWQEFEAPVGVTVAQCLEEIPAEWLNDSI